MAKKKLAVIILIAAILCLALAPESVAARCHHHRVYRSRAVAGVAYYHHNHATRNRILTVLGTAAFGAGLGALAGGSKGAGIGALAGGGAGAGYFLIKHNLHHHRRL